MPSLAYNKRAKFDYDLLDTFEGGLKLTGPEVKAAKLGHMQMQGAFLHVRRGELWLKNAFIGKYAPAGTQEGYDPTRTRKVLVKRSEITRLIGKTQADGLTLVPISVYTRGNLIKLEFALARGKRQYEKRETIKKRDVERQIRERMRE
jgi:SsrA-binding protein